jgi:hypothetical protein
MLVQALAIIGAIILTLVIMYMVMRYIKHDNDKTTKMYPTRQYMQYEGQNCPDYWLYTNGVCKNIYNISVPSNSTCYNHSINDREAYFEPIHSFPKGPGNEMDNVLKSRCNWIRKCGPVDKNGHKLGNAGWDGIDKYC